MPRKLRVMYTLRASGDLPDMAVLADDILFVRDDGTTALARKCTTDYQTLTRGLALGQFTLVRDDEDGAATPKPDAGPAQSARSIPGVRTAEAALEAALADLTSDAGAVKEPAAEDLLGHQASTCRDALGDKAYWPLFRFRDWRDRVLSRTPRPCSVCGADFVCGVVRGRPSRARCAACVAAKKQRCSGCGLVFTAATIHVRRCPRCPRP